MRQKGFSAIEAIIIIIVVILLGLGAWFVISKNKETNEGVFKSGDKVSWSYNGSAWVPSSQPPTCPDPLVFDNSPVDAELVSSLLFPGQYRGDNYKAHGGFRFDGTKSSDVTVRLPMDGQLTGLVRYIERGELQYLVTLTNDCGISYRFDHIATLSDEFQEIAETTPAAKVDDTSSMPIENGSRFKAGDVVATAVGFPKTGNISLDFGVYDLRQPNQISKNAEWAALHRPEQEQTYYGVCWFDMLPEPDKTTIHNLAVLQANQGEISDYCSIATRTTLD